MDRTSLGDRMKQYEAVPKNYLMRKTPVIIRIDGRCFHTITRGFDKPFDWKIERAMEFTTLYLCQNIQGCVMGYTQSDEITLVLCDYQKIDTDAWFGYNIQKMCSIAASMATFAFSNELRKIADEVWDYDRQCRPLYEEDHMKMIEFLLNKVEKGIFFDARCFSLPKNEVVNCLIWRQQDATRNSIQGLAQSLFSHNEIQGINCKDLQDKIFKEKGINWNSLPDYQKRGACVIKNRSDEWVIDFNIPIFTQDRNYIERRLEFLKEENG